jgi:hypothetical protein
VFGIIELMLLLIQKLKYIIFKKYKFVKFVSFDKA